jgi:hypothetical protein
MLGCQREVRTEGKRVDQKNENENSFFPNEWGKPERTNKTERRIKRYPVAVAAKRCEQYVYNVMQAKSDASGFLVSLQLPHRTSLSIPDKLNKRNYKTSPIEREALNVRSKTLETN